jgi:hypothetical protein
MFNKLFVQIETKRLWKIAVFYFALCFMGGFVVRFLTLPQIFSLLFVCELEKIHHFDACS